MTSKESIRTGENEYRQDEIDDQRDTLVTISDSMMEKDRPSYLKVSHNAPARHQISPNEVGRNIISAKHKTKGHGLQR